MDLPQPTQLPMSFANIPQQADTRTPLAVKPPPNIDVIGQTDRAYTLAHNMRENEVESQQMADQKIIQAALQEGGNMNTPDGVESLSNSLKGKVSPTTYQSLVDRKAKLEDNAFKVQQRMSTLDEEKLTLAQKQTDITLKSLSGLLDDFEEGKKTDPAAAMNDFAQKKQATITALAESGMIKPQIAQQMMQLSPTQLKSALETTKFWQDQMRAAAELKEKNARAAKEQAQADQITQGGARVAELQALKDQFGEDSPEYKAGVQRLSGAKGATNVEPTMTPDAIELAAKRLLKGDNTALQNIGRGVQGAANITAINNRLAALAKEQGVDESGLLKARAELKAAGTGLNDLSKRSAKIDAAVIEVDKFADNALAALEKVSRGDVVPVNEIMRRVAEGSGSPEEAAFSTYVKSLSGAYANVLGRGTSTVFSQTEADKIIRKDYSKAQFKAMVEALKKEAAAVQASSREAGENIKKETFGDHPKLDPKEQKVRDTDSVAILQEELKKAQARDAELSKDPSGKEQEKQRNDADIAGLKKELARHGVKVADSKPAEKKKSAKDYPPKNTKGWELHEDKAANLAYVSPDGKQYEEVK